MLVDRDVFFFYIARIVGNSDTRVSRARYPAESNGSLATIVCSCREQRCICGLLSRVFGERSMLLPGVSRSKENAVLICAAVGPWLTAVPSVVSLRCFSGCNGDRGRIKMHEAGEGRKSSNPEIFPEGDAGSRGGRFSLAPRSFVEIRRRETQTSVEVVRILQRSLSSPLSLAV